MKFFFKTLLPFIIMFFVNMYAIRYAFEGMTAPHDLTFIGGVVLLAALVVGDVTFIIWRIKRAIRQYKSKDGENNNEHASA
jgi:multisubunit Na+/H+ antiporter MnhB subunit